VTRAPTEGRVARPKRRWDCHRDSPDRAVSGSSMRQQQQYKHRLSVDTEANLDKHNGQRRDVDILGCQAVSILIHVDTVRTWHDTKPIKIMILLGFTLV